MTNLSRKERERISREKAMLDVAEKIFARDGYANASINEIAKTAEFSKRTLYQYFSSKSDLYLSVALRIYQSMMETVDEMHFTETTGRGMIKEMFDAYYQFYRENETIFRIIYDIGKVRQETTNNPKLVEFLKIDHILFKNIQNLIRLGQEDGSLNKELEADIAARSLIFLLTAFFNQLTITGDSFTSHIKMDKDRFSTYVLNFLHTCLR